MERNGGSFEDCKQTIDEFLDLQHIWFSSGSEFVGGEERLRAGQC